MSFLSFIFTVLIIYIILTLTIRPRIQKRFAPNLERTSPNLGKGIEDTLDFDKNFEFGTGTDDNQLKDIDADIEILKRMNMKVFRFSLPWDKIQPGKYKVDNGLIDYYITLVKKLSSNNITPFITLWSNKLPEWIQKEGGVLAKDFPNYFCSYTQLIAENFTNVKNWISVDKPNLYAFNEYIKKDYAFNLTDANEAASILVNCHTIAYGVIHGTIKDAKVSFTIQSTPFWPEHRYSLIETVIANILNKFNYVVFDEINDYETSTRKSFPLDFIAVSHSSGQWVSYNWKHWDTSVTVNMKFATIGRFTFPVFGSFIDTYFNGAKNLEIRPTKIIIPFLSIQSHIYETSDTNACVAYDSLSSSIRWVYESFNNNEGLEIVVTENGIDDKSDKLRRKFLQLTLLYLKNNMLKRGLPITTYIYWSLFDKKEGDQTEYCGLVEEKNGVRVSKQSSEVYKRIAACTRD